MVARNKTPPAEIPVKVNEQGAIQGLKKTVDAFSRSAVQINQTLEVVGKVWGVVSGAISGAIDRIREWVSLANIQEKAELKFAGALKARGQFTKDIFDSTLALNGAIQQSIGIGDEELLGLQARLAGLNVLGKNIGAATRQTIGLAEVTGSLESASVLVAKAQSGNVASLKEYNIEAKDAADAQRQLNDLYGIADGRAKAFGTRSLILSANIGDLKEQLGFAVTKSTAANGILDALNKTTVEFSTFLSGPEGTHAVNLFARSLAGVGSAAINSALAIGSLFDRAKSFLADRKIGAFLGLDVVAEPIGPRDSPLQNLADRLDAIATGTADTEVAGGAGGKKKKRQGPKFVEQTGAMDAAVKAREAFFTEELKREATQLEAKEDLRQLNERLELESQARRLDVLKKFGAEERKQKEMAQERRLTEIQNVAEWGGVVSDVTGGAMLAIFDSIASGENVLAGLGKFFGGLIRQTGVALVQMGTAAAILGTLGLVTGLPIGGGPAGIAAGGVAVAAGGAMIVLGQAMGGGGSAQGGRANAGSGTRGDSDLVNVLPRGPQAASAVPVGFTGLQQGGPVNRTYNITFRGMVFGSKAELGRGVRDAVRAADRLAGAPVVQGGF